eukprot:c8766_g1_i1.p1 GENE.c8766_g1_i1~~c8766_g1_i1.p1  ORF type:complete len:832 (-),score=166.43 c8766_g1_i1:209-2704(-)
MCGLFRFSLLVLAAVHIHCQQQVETEQPALTHTVEKADRGSVIVKEFLIDSDVEDIKWAGKTNKVVVVKSAAGTIYRSEDNGKTWENQMQKMRGSLVEVANGKAGIQDVMISEADRDYIFFQGRGDTHWVTRDAGKTYDMLAGSFPIKQIILHKTHPDWVLASRWSQGCKLTEAKQNCSVEVHLSLDFGRSWSFLDSYVAQFSWGRPHKPEEIFMVKFENKEGNQRFGAWDKDADFFKSDDLWKSFTKFIPHGNRFLMLDKYLFVAMVNIDKENEVQLVVGRDDVIVYEIGRLPFELREHSYTILDTSEGAVFLHVNHGDFSTPFGNIYLSDADGWRYSLSLKNNRRDMRGRCDFEKFQGLEGIYIANYVENPEYLDNWGEKEHLVTVMTFDKGGRWSKIKAPTHDAEGKDTACVLEEGCSLHLHGITDEWGPFYTTKSALGLVMATGNTGKFLDMSHGGRVNTYFSRDAGQTWYEVRKGSHIYEFGDHGALTVMAKDRELTSEILYTWNEGMSWKAVPLPASTDVDNIITEPNSTSTSFVLYGSRNGAGVLVSIDFSNLHVAQCQGIEAAGRPESAYELWSPTGGSQSKCLLGRQVHYTRRKRAEECFNGFEHERQTFIQNCPCTEDDYECDYGYERQGLDGPCVAIKAIRTEAPAQCPPGSEYTISNGYRRVAGDSCDAVTGVNHLPMVISCPSLFGPVTSNGRIVLILLFVLAGGLFVATYLNKDPEALERLRSWMSETKFKYKKLEMKPDTFSDDDFDLGEELDDDQDAQVMNDTNLNTFGDEPTDSAFGPLPVSSTTFDSAPVPALQPPPTAPTSTHIDVFSALSQ